MVISCKLKLSHGRINAGKDGLAELQIRKRNFDSLGEKTWQKDWFKGIWVCFLTLSIPVWSSCHFFPTKYLSVHTFNSILYQTGTVLKAQLPCSHITALLLTASVFSMSHSECYSDIQLLKNSLQFTMKETETIHSIQNSETAKYTKSYFSQYFL